MISIDTINVTYDNEGEVIRNDFSSENYTVSELAEKLKFDLFCGVPSCWPLNLNVGSDLSNVFITEEISDDRECIEKGYVKYRSLHFSSGQSSNNLKYWRKLFLLLSNADRLIH